MLSDGACVTTVRPRCCKNAFVVFACVVLDTPSQGAGRPSVMTQSTDMPSPAFDYSRPRCCPSRAPPRPRRHPAATPAPSKLALGLGNQPGLDRAGI